MKLTMKTAFFAGCLTMALSTVPTNAGLFSSALPKDAVDKIISTVSSKGAPFLCRKGDASNKIFSGRSFGGKLCEKKEFAAIMEEACGSNKDYKNSGCAKKAAQALKGTTAKAVLGSLKDKGLKILAEKVNAVKK